MVRTTIPILTTAGLITVAASGAWPGEMETMSSGAVLGDRALQHLPGEAGAWPEGGERVTMESVAVISPSCLRVVTSGGFLRRAGPGEAN